MNRLEFDALTIIKQLEFINNKAKTETLTNICKKIGVGRSTMTARARKVGYSFNKDISQYAQSNTEVIQLHQSNVLVPLQSQEKAITSIESDDAKVLLKYENDMMELIDNKVELLEMLKYYKNNTNIVDVPQLDMEELPKDYKDNIINKSIKIYESVYEMFNNLCESYESHKKQDMISLALYQFCKIYKK